MSVPKTDGSAGCTLNSYTNAENKCRGHVFPSVLSGTSDMVYTGIQVNQIKR